MRLAMACLLVISVCLLAIGCSRGSESGAGQPAQAAAPESPPPPRFTPLLTQEHLPPALRTMKIGETTMEQAKALFPATEHLTPRVILDTSMGGERDFVHARGPNKGLHYSQVSFVRMSKADGSYYGTLGEEYQRAVFSFAKMSGSDSPVLYSIEAVQISKRPEGTPEVCAPARAALASDPAAVQGCPEGFSSNATTEGMALRLCVGSPDGQLAATVECSNSGGTAQFMVVVPQSGSTSAPSN